MLGLSLFLVSLFSPFALANDSSAEISAGGITLKKQSVIRMNQEDLFISSKRVEVRYEFENPSDRLIETEVAFPLPPYSAAESPGSGDPSFLDFAAEADGKPIALEIEAKAFLKGKDVTAKLKEFGADVLSINAAWSKFSPEGFGLYRSSPLIPLKSREEALRLGFIDYLGHGMPGWEVRAIYHWKQAFPAHSRVHIKHTYTPSVGHSPIDSYSAKALEKYYKGACLTSESANHFRTAFGTDDKVAGFAEWVKYILVTAKNWNGPIAKFNLVVEKENDGLMSTCFKGLKVDGKNTFKFSKENFIPRDDLLIYFLNWSPITPYQSPPFDPNKVISENGVGKIDANTPVDVTVVQKLFPGYIVKSGQLYSKEHQVAENVEVYDPQYMLRPSIELISDGVGSKKLFSVVVNDDAYRTAAGFHARSLVSEYLKMFPTRSCIKGIDVTQDSATCSESGSKVSYVIQPLFKEEMKAVDQGPVIISKDWNRMIWAIVWRPNLNSGKKLK